MERNSIKKILGRDFCKNVGDKFEFWLPVDITSERVNCLVQEYRAQIKDVISPSLFLREFDFEDYIEQNEKGEWQLGKRIP